MNSDDEQGNIEDHKAIEAEKIQNKFKDKLEKYTGNIINDSESIQSFSDRSHKEDSHRDLNF